MNYRNYKKSRDLAWRILLQEGVRELPVNIVALCKQMGDPGAVFHTSDRRK